MYWGINCNLSSHDALKHSFKLCLCFCNICVNFESTCSTVYMYNEITTDYCLYFILFNLYQDGTEVVFKIKRQTPLRKLMTAYADKQAS